MRISHRRGGLSLALIGATIHAAAWYGTYRGSLWWGVWFYQAAWWSYVMVAGGLLTLAGHRSLVVDEWREFLVMAPLSVVWWLLFDMYGLRLRNWYYVMLPPSCIERWAGFWLAFATVIPLCMITKALVDSRGIFQQIRWRPFALTPGLLRRMWVAGLAMCALPLMAPQYLFPLTWVFAPLLIEPWLVRKDRGSLLSRLSRGEPAPLLSLLLSGVIVGGLWELFNSRSVSRWIYTVPEFEEGKLFEMPVLGFLGFPPFVVGTYSFWRLMKTLIGSRASVSAALAWHPGSRAVIWVVVTIPLCVGGFAALDAGAVRSTLPMARDLPGWEPGMGIDGDTQAMLLTGRELGLVPDSLQARWRRLLHLADLRGMGLRRAEELTSMGITTPQQLTRCATENLRRRWPSQDMPRSSEIDIWIAGAQRRIEP